VGVGKAHKYFPFMQFCGLNTTALAFKNAIATRKEIRYFINKIYFLMAVACFNKLSFSTQTAWLFAPDKLLYRKILWALPKPAIFEKIE